MRLVTSISLLLLAVASASPAKEYSLADSPRGLQVRFSEATITAIRSATNCFAMPLKEQPPRAKYDKKQKKDILEPVVRWFEAHTSETRPLSESSYGAFVDLLLNPTNHYSGLYCVSEPSVMAIRFVADGKIGYIVLHSSIVEVLWDDANPSALLNAQGRMALQNWIQENG